MRIVPQDRGRTNHILLATGLLLEAANVHVLFFLQYMEAILQFKFKGFLRVGIL